MLTNLVSSYANNSPCKSCHAFAYVFLHRFQVHILLTRHLPRGHSISFPTYDSQRTIKKPFTGLIRLRYVTAKKKMLPMKAGWKDISLVFRSLNATFILLLFDGLCKVKVEHITAQKIKFSIKDFSRKCDQIRSFLRIWSHLLKKS